MWLEKVITIYKYKKQRYLLPFTILNNFPFFFAITAGQKGNYSKGINIFHKNL